MKIHLRTPIRRRIAGWSVAASAAVVLAACGGGGSNDNTSSTSVPIVTTPPLAAGVPASAVVDIASFVNYLNTLVSIDTQEALLTDAVTPPTTDTGEPTTI